MSTHKQVFVLTYICSSLGDILRCEIPAFYVTFICLTFWRTARLFLKAAVPLYIPIGNVWGIHFLHILPNIKKKKIFVINHLVFEHRNKAGWI